MTAPRLAGIAFLVGLGVATAAPVPLDRAIRLPAGIRLRPPRGFMVTPQPAPRIATYSTTDGSRKIEAVDPVEQWRYVQQIATFKGETGEIHLAHVKHVPIENLRLLSGGHAPKADFDRQIAQCPPPADPAAYRQWIETWAGHPTNAPQTKLRGVLLRYKYMYVTFPQVAPQNDQVWLLAMHGGALMLRFQLPKLSERDAARTALSILKSVSQVRTEEAAPNGDAPLGEARQRVQQGIRNVPGWWTVETRNYVIASNLPKRSRALVEDLQRDAEIIRAVYESLFPPVAPITAVSVIRVFADKEGYRNYVSPDMKWTAGVWDPSRKELVIAGDDAASSRDLRDSILNTAWHEAFHQYLFYALDRRQPPIWLNEGFACLFESCEIDTVRGSMRIKDNESRREWLQHLIRERPANADVARLLRMNRLQFYLMGQSGKAADIARSDNYALAWGLAWYLSKAAPLHHGKDYDQIVPAILAQLGRSDDTIAAREAGATAANLANLQRDFLDFWQDSRAQGKAERNLILPRLK